MAISQELIRVVVEQFPLWERGMHGVPHWARVLENGRRLAEQTGARLDVVELFSIFHDSRRINEGTDPGHGLRGAEYARTVRGHLFDLDDEGMDLLFEACARHSDGLTEGDITVLTCWDADRLDLLRVGIRPDRRYLGTEAAKDEEVMAWANGRADRWKVIPALVVEEWGLELVEERK